MVLTMYPLDLSIHSPSLVPMENGKLFKVSFDKKRIVSVVFAKLIQSQTDIAQYWMNPFDLKFFVQFLTQDFQLTSSQGRSWTWQPKSFPRKRIWLTLASLRLLSSCLHIPMFLSREVASVLNNASRYSVSLELLVLQVSRVLAMMAIQEFWCLLALHKRAGTYIYSLWLSIMQVYCKIKPS